MTTSTAVQPHTGPHDFAAHRAALYGDGFTALSGAFPAELVATVDEDIKAVFAEAQQIPGGTVPRGPQRWYVEMHAERLRAFADIVSHPWVHGLCLDVLGPDYRIIEVAFDIPFPGAKMQPWHRDFPMPTATRDERRLTSLAFNMATLDVTDEMGPFELAPGTQWDNGDEWPARMFPPKDTWDRYEERRTPKYGRIGGISSRSALTIHRGTPNVSQVMRPVLVIACATPDGEGTSWHEMQMTHAFWDSLPQSVRDHINPRLVDTLEPITQLHQIAGLESPADVGMGETDED